VKRTIACCEKTAIKNDLSKLENIEKEESETSRDSKPKKE